MSDTDSDGDTTKNDEEKSNESSFNMGGFMFGNIDSKGDLDNEDQHKLFSDVGGFESNPLKRLGAMLRSNEDDSLSNVDMGEDVSGIDILSRNVEEASPDSSDQEDDEERDEIKKSDSAGDFYGMDDALTDEDDVIDKNIVDKIDENSVSPVKKEEDKKLMPPPSSSPPSSSSLSSKLQVNNHVKNDATNDQTLKKVRPLEDLLPEKYKNVDVKEVFPEFRESQVLRFSRLFGVKESMRPKMWKALSKSSTMSKVDPPTPNDRVGYNGGSDINILPFPDDPNAYVEDQWTTVLKDESLPKSRNGINQSKSILSSKTPSNSSQNGAQSTQITTDVQSNSDIKSSSGPKASDWRTGPAQYWYDMLGLPLDIEDYDYGLKMKKFDENETEDAVKSIENVFISDTRKKQDSKITKNKSTDSVKSLFPDDAFFMVSQVRWEDDVVWDGEEIRQKVMAKLASANLRGGDTGVAWWSCMPPSTSRSRSSRSSNITIADQHQKQNSSIQNSNDPNNNTFYSIFPVESEDLVYGRWEDDVIWDTENMTKKLRPKLVSLDPNDDNIILDIPEDIDPSTLPSNRPMRKIKVLQKHVKKSRMLLNRSGIISVVEEETPLPIPKILDKDPFNISNDEFYTYINVGGSGGGDHGQEPGAAGGTGGGGKAGNAAAPSFMCLQHATPVVELKQPFVPTHIGPVKLRQFHRWPMKRFSHGVLANFTIHHPLKSLNINIKRADREREAERLSSGGGEIFFMRTPDDISGKDGQMCLFEYSEQFPPFLSLCGMASKLKNYYKRKPGLDIVSFAASKFKFGELTVAHTSPFLGLMAPGQIIQTLENNLYRAPVYEHKLNKCLFVLIRTRNQYYIRRADALFCVGQECPLTEVPGPNSKKANLFARDFLQVCIYRLFAKSHYDPRRIRIDEVKKAFPAHSESSIRKRLKPCADFRRTGHDFNWWVMKKSFRLPTEEEMRALITPEQCCAFFSMLAAEQRLRDAGYGERFMLLLSTGDDDDHGGGGEKGEDGADSKGGNKVEMDDEVKAAPWNTTRAYMLAVKGKCLLQLTGPSDPTGPAGEGFSYVRIPNKPVSKDVPKDTQDAAANLINEGRGGGVSGNTGGNGASSASANSASTTTSSSKGGSGGGGDANGAAAETGSGPGKRTVTGTDADLRKLPLKDARNILRKNGVPEAEIMKLKRWEVIDVVRTLSTEKVKAGEDGDHKFSRGNRFSIAEHQERYREECQRIFEVQNKVLGSDEILSSDDGGSSSEDSDVNDLDEMGKSIEHILANKKSKSQYLHEREEAERKILQKMMMSGGSATNLSSASSSQSVSGSQQNLTKSAGSSSGTTSGVGSSATGTVCSSKNGESSTVPKILRINRTFKNTDGTEYRRTELVRRGAVVELYARIRDTRDTGYIRQFALIDDALKEEMKREKRRLQDQMRRLKKLKEKERKFAVQAAQNIHQNNPSANPGSASGSNPVDVASSSTSELPSSTVKCRACGAHGHMKSNKACPKYVEPPSPYSMGDVSSSTALAEALLETDMDGELVKMVEGTKMTVSTKVLKHAEELRRKQEEEADLRLLRLSRSRGSDPGLKGADSGDPSTAESDQHEEEEEDEVGNSYESSSKNFESMGSNKKRSRAKSTDQDDYLSKHYKVNKRRRIDPIVSLASIFDTILSEIRTMDEALQFLQPVNTKKVVDYLDKISTPMDLQRIRENVHNKKYQSREEFLADMTLIVENSIAYNGSHDFLTRSARKLLDCVVEKFSENEESIMGLEKMINPLLDDNHQVALTYIFKNVLEHKLMTMQESWPFLKPVNKKVMKHYYTVVSRPIDLETISTKLNKHQYSSYQSFMDDIQLIYDNSCLFNGEQSDFTRKAFKLVQTARDATEPFMSHVISLESKIRDNKTSTITTAFSPSVGRHDEESSQMVVQFDINQIQNASMETPAFSLSMIEEEEIKTSESSVITEYVVPSIDPQQQQQNLEGDLEYSSEEEEEEEGVETDLQTTQMDLVESYNANEVVSIIQHVNLDDQQQDALLTAPFTIPTVVDSSYDMISHNNDEEQNHHYHNNMVMTDDYDPTADFLNQMNQTIVAPNGINGGGDRDECQIGNDNNGTPEKAENGGEEEGLADDLDISSDEGGGGGQAGGDEEGQQNNDEDGIWF